MAKPSIAILHYSCPPVIGGVEFVIEDHALHLAKAGFKLKMIVGKGDDMGPDVPADVIPELSSKGGPVASGLRALARGEVPASFEKSVKTVEKKLSSALKGVDVCMMHNVMTMHFNLILTAALTNVMKRNKKTRFIAWTHDMTFSDPLYESHQHRRYPWSLLSHPAENCNYCVISAQRGRDMAKVFHIPVSKIPVIPDGIDVPRRFHLTRRVRDLYYEEDIARMDIVALTPARILRRKNLGMGMEIVAALKKRGKKVRWMITGAPDPHNPDSVQYFKLLQKLRKTLKLQKEVIFLCERFDRRVMNKDLRSLYRFSDMLLFPSESEGFGLPVLEAGLGNLLQVISDIPCLKELAGGDVVYIESRDTPAAVAGKIIKKIKALPHMAYRKKVMRTYSWDIVMDERIIPAILNPRSTWR